jgi:hypothetical protein
MARKKVKRYAAGDEIVVTGQRKVMPDAASDFMLERMMRQPVTGVGDGMSGSGGGRRPITSDLLPEPASTSSAGPRITPTAISQPRSTLGTLTGTAAPRGYGVKMSTRFKKGGSVSSASKRADGCATKGKTRGKLV